MQITDVRVRRIEKEGKMKAIVSITLDNEFVVHDIKVIEGARRGFSSPCRAVRQPMGSTEILPIRSARDFVQIRNQRDGDGGRRSCDGVAPCSVLGFV